MKKQPKRILAVASKCITGPLDGVQRYGIELLRGLLDAAENRPEEWLIDVYLGAGSLHNVLELKELIRALPIPSNSANEMKILNRITRVKGLAISKIIESFPPSLVNLIERVKKQADMQIYKRIRKLDFREYDLVHVILPQDYVEIALCQTQLILTVHDFSHLYCPQFHQKPNALAAKKGLDLAVAKGANFIAVSKSTRHDFLANYKTVNPANVTTVYEGCDRKKFTRNADINRLLRVKKKYKIPEKHYILSVGTLEPRKNLPNTIRAFLLLLKENPDLDLYFVVGGRKGWKFEELFNEPELQSTRVIYTGFIDDDDLPVLYSGAIAFAYVSYYEGFGLPPLEAMSCGTPVVYGNNSSLKEIVGNAGLPAEADDVVDIKEQLKIMVLDGEKRTAMSRRALVNLHEFSWGATIRKTLQTYEKAILNHR